MNLEDLIATEEICTIYKVEHTFISSLHESGIIEIVTVEEKEYVRSENLGQFERMMRLHQDLNINPEGLAAVKHLLDRLEELQQINQQLRNRLGLYE
ncbi:chaperone modulator CbpM [Salegentibacter chungangensis]|uniref:Chaperone modulator CbpM n=1 Tax=Salegentibacter chungangensis TaxID=1335724 RepID=A0ABW3NNN2_9FLAO